jgi:hypothetical protein
MSRQNFLFDFDFFAFRFQPQSQAPERAHIDIRDPDESENGDDQTPEIVKQQAITCQQNEEERYPVAQAVFAGEHIEELALKEVGAFFAALRAVFTRFAEDLFVRNRPRNAGDRDGEHE